MILNENLIYYIWQYKRFEHNNLKTTAGEPIEIIQYGNRNLSSGPDFSNAKIKIGDIIWAGNVEMHVFSSDWQKHKHQNDQAYNNVILHVVYEEDRKINDIPTLELKYNVDQKLLEKFETLMNSTQWISCEQSLPSIDKNKFPIWSHRIAIERLERKCSKINESNKENDWQQLLYEQIAKYFGAVHNEEAFENLAKKLPYKILLKNKHQPHVIEALIFGVAGFLGDDLDDQYYQSLKKEYSFQKAKYNLIELNNIVWKKFGMYAAGSPIYRLAQFSALINKSNDLFNECLESNSRKDILSIFDCTLNHYWENHYKFGKVSTKKNNKISKEFIDRIIINAIIPSLFNYFKQNGKEAEIERLTNILNEIKSEKNHIINKWKSYGFDINTAIESQALIELKSRYCDTKSCLFCPIGKEILKI